MILSNISEYINYVLNKLVKYCSLIPSWILVFLTLCTRYLMFVPRPNEEQYLSLSKHFMDPSWIPGCINLGEFPGTRLLYQIVAGTFLKYFSFEYVVFGGRLFLAILFSFAISKIYKILKLDNFVLLLHLTILFFLRQAYFGGSWIFLSFEAKSFAYLFIFLSIASYLKDDIKWMTIHCVIASYFHILVGGFTFGYLLLSLLVLDKSYLNRNNIRLIGHYILSILPLIVYMQSAFSVPDIDGTVSTDWIYSYYRNPHHTVILKDWVSFRDLHLRGVITSLLSVIFLLAFFKNQNDAGLKKLVSFSSLALLGSVVLILVFYIDSEGRFLKYYLHRINTLGVFFSMLFYAIVFLKYIRKVDAKNVVLSMIVVFSCFKFFNFTINNIKGNHAYFYRIDKAYHEICELIKEKTEEDAIILYLTKDNQGDGQFDFNRRAERSRFVIKKFVPGEMGKLQEWYDRINKRKKIFDDITNLGSVSKQYEIDYILAKRTYAELELIAESYPYKLYRNRSD